MPYAYSQLLHHKKLLKIRVLHFTSYTQHYEINPCMQVQELWILPKEVSHAYKKYYNFKTFNFIILIFFNV